jgi:hypothetical protein
MTLSGPTSRRARARRSWHVFAVIAALASGMVSLPVYAQSPAKGFEPVPVEGAPGFEPVTPSGAGPVHSAEVPSGRSAHAGHDKAAWQRTAKSENR